MMKPLAIGLFILAIIRPSYGEANGSITAMITQFPTTTEEFTTGKERSTDPIFAATSGLEEDTSLDGNAQRWLNTDLIDGNSLSTMSAVGETTIKVNAQETNSYTDSDPLATWIWQPVVLSWWLGFQILSLGLGVVGNLLVIIVLFERRGHSSSADSLIGNLAVADFLTSLCLLPLPRASRVPATVVGELYCKVIFTSSLMWFSVTASISTLTTISLDRFFAIVFPLHFNRYKSRSNIIICIFLLWFAAFALKIYVPLTMHVDKDSRSCKVKYASSRGQLITGVAAYLVNFVFPASIMLTTQVLAARSLHLQAKRFSGSSKSSLNLLAAKTRVLQMLSLVVAVFIVCWGPNEAAYFLYNLRVLDSTYLYGPVDRILIMLAFYNSCANAIVYAVRYPQFRTAIKRLLTCGKGSNSALFEDHGDDRVAKTSTTDQLGTTEVRSKGSVFYLCPLTKTEPYL